MTVRIPAGVIACLLASLAALLGGCGDGNDGTGIFGGAGDPAPQPPASETVTFWATDLTTDADYQLQADKVGEGTRCRVFLEHGRTVGQATVDAVIAQFDTRIHPADTGAFGSEPNPGIDNDPKIVILLLDVRDGYTPGGGYVAGYFSPFNEVRQADLPVGRHSNEREMVYMDINPGTAGDSQFLRTLAHEFQHMIHFHQEEITKGGFGDDIWLNEAMSLIAPVYCSYGPDYLRVGVFQTQPSNSLTTWDSSVEDYGVAYMWAQYVKDRIDPSSGNTVFWRMLHRPETGIASVDAALLEIGYGKDFGAVFRDWAVAVYAGNALSWPGHPEWSYTSINTWPGVYPLGDGYAIELPGMFGFPAWTDCTALGALPPWSVDYYLYNPVSGNTGSVRWTAASPSGWASLGDNAALTFGLTSGGLYPYTGAGYLVVANPSNVGSGAGGVAYASRLPGPATALEMLLETRRNPGVARLVAATGRPFPVCVQPFLSERARRPEARTGPSPSR